MFEVEHAFDALPFFPAAARRFTSMAKLVVAAGRNPKPRKFALMIAAIASVNDIPLYTSNVADFRRPGLNRHGFGSASVFEEDGSHHVEALPARGS